MSNPQHQSLTNEHYTPPQIIAYVKAVMGEIDLDPCTDKEVNDWQINAKNYFTKNGLTEINFFFGKRIGQPPAKVWCNPPGGKNNNQSSAKLWLEKIAHLYEVGDIEQAFFLLFNREFLGHHVLRGIPRLNFSQRVKYWSWNDFEGKYLEGQWRVFDKRGEMVTVRRASDIEEWEGVTLDRQVVHSARTKQALHLWLKARRYGIREWANAPTHQSTLIYFPPREGEWRQKILDAMPLLNVKGDYWVFPE